MNGLGGPRAGLNARATKRRPSRWWWRRSSWMLRRRMAGKTSESGHRERGSGRSLCLLYVRVLRRPSLLHLLKYGVCGGFRDIRSQRIGSSESCCAPSFTLPTASSRRRMQDVRSAYNILSFPLHSCLSRWSQKVKNCVGRRGGDWSVDGRCVLFLVSTSVLFLVSTSPPFASTTVRLHRR